MGDARLSQDGGNGQLGGLDGVVGGGEHRVHLAQHGVDGGNDLVGGGARLLQIGDALLVQIGLGLLNGGGAVHLGGGVQQAHRLDVRVGRQHHVQQQLYVQRVAGAGDIVDAGEVGHLRVADGAVDHRGLALLRHGHHLLGGQGADGQNLSADLRQRRGVVVAVEVLIADGETQLRRLGIQLGKDGVPDLVHGRVVQLPDHGDLVAAVRGGRLAATGGVLGGTAGAAGTGGQGQGERQGQGRGQKLLHRVLFHGNTSIVCPLGAEICLGG